MSVFNSAFKKAKKDGLGKSGADKAAFRQANSVVFSQAWPGTANPGGEESQRELSGEQKDLAIEYLKSVGQYKENDGRRSVHLQSRPDSQPHNGVD